MQQVALTEEERQLVAQNEWLIWAFCAKHRLNGEAWYGLFAEALCKAAKKYDPKKAKFSTWGMRFIRFAWGHELMINHRKLKDVTPVEPLNARVSFSEGEASEYMELMPDEDKTGYRELLGFISGLSEQEKIIARDMILHESNKRTAERLGISKSTMTRWKKAFQTKINDFIEERKY